MPARSIDGDKGEDGIVHRMAAIAVIDIVGHVSLMVTDVQMYRRWQLLLDTVIRPQTDAHRGSITTSTGDGAVIEFPSAREAVDWALVVRRFLPPERDGHPFFSVRIGIHVGYIMVRGSDVFGDDVNVAMRLNQYARAGGVVISEAVHDTVRLRVRARDLGVLEFKNLLKPIRAYTLDVETDETSEVPRIIPPTVPLPSPGPASRFDYFNGQFDVVAPAAWHLQSQAPVYHARARALAVAFALRLEKTDAVPDLAGSVSALIDILGDNFANVQPDQLRLASRSIMAKARVYGHPAAQWEISPEAVSSLFELADALTDLQSFARTEIEAHENAIRELDLTPQNVAEAKAGLDFVSEGVLASQEIISERVEIAFEAATEVSDTASDEQVKVAVEGDRTLLTANLALAVARQLGRDADAAAAQAAGGPPDKPPEPPAQPPERPERPERRRRARQGRGGSERSWDDFADRVMARIHKKGPEALADATIQAAASTVKHAPKTAAALGAALVVWSMSNPIVLAGGGIAATIAWIGYELRRRNTSQGK